ncbi:LAS superfamily LD-carboxypeptidase LdcB [Rahnella inusitata]|nr:LAS superfamily LD-carboxypeptidase LdcB [Rahnella inusitata]
MGKNQHVVTHDGQWAVRGEGNTRVTSLHQTQQQAIDAARAIAQNQGSELLIHGKNGQIRARDSHGKDPSSIEG